MQVFDNGGPNNVHAEPCIAAAEAGKAIFCEKPLGRTAEESKRMLDAVTKAGVKHMVSHNYRFVPAIVLARQLIQSGKLGRIYHFRATYQQEWIMDPNFERVWRLDKSVAGSGALGDLGSHIIDLARYLVAEPTKLMAMTKTFIDERPLPDGSGMGKVEVDDAFVSTVEFANGALGTLEATRFAAGRKNYEVLEINGANGSLRFNMERMNELKSTGRTRNRKKRAVSTPSTSPSRSIPTWKTGGPKDTSSATSIRSSTSSTISSTASSTISRSRRWRQTSRTATATP